MILRAAVLALCLAASPQSTGEPPYTVASELFDPAEPDLGLQPAPGTETFTVFRPGEDTDRFSNGVVLIGFKGRLYAQWQTSPRDEDTPDTRVAFAVSEDGDTGVRRRPLFRRARTAGCIPAAAGGRTARLSSHM